MFRPQLVLRSPAGEPSPIFTVGGEVVGVNKKATACGNQGRCLLNAGHRVVLNAAERLDEGDAPEAGQALRHRGESAHLTAL